MNTHTPPPHAPRFPEPLQLSFPPLSNRASISLLTAGVPLPLVYLLPFLTFAPMNHSPLLSLHDFFLASAKTAFAVFCIGAAAAFFANLINNDPLNPHFLLSLLFMFTFGATVSAILLAAACACLQFHSKRYPLNN